MTGSLQVKSGKFYMVLNSTENGKRKQRWISTGLPEKGNKRKAEQMLREQLVQEREEESLPQPDMLVADCIRHWLSCVERRVDAVTYLGYLNTAEKQVLPYFDANGLTLQGCTVKALQAYFDEKSRSGRLDGKGGLSAKTMRHHRNIIRQSLAEAVKENLLTSNPCDYVELPRHERFEAAFYSADQIQHLFDVMEGDPLLPLVKITALYGLRRSEVLGLKWDSVDFKNDILLIRHTVCKMMTRIEKDKTKTQSSRRSFPLTPDARSIFLAAKTAEEEGFPEAAYAFSQIAEVEKIHGERFAKIAEMLKKETYYESSGQGEWMCLNCGHIFKGEKVPPVCPVCRHERGYFIPACMAPYLGFSACR